MSVDRGAGSIRTARRKRILTVAASLLPPLALLIFPWGARGFDHGGVVGDVGVTGWRNFYTKTHGSDGDLLTGRYW